MKFNYKYFKIYTRKKNAIKNVETALLHKHLNVFVKYVFFFIIQIIYGCKFCLFLRFKLDQTHMFDYRGLK